MKEPGLGCRESAVRDDSLNLQATAREGEYSAHYSVDQWNVEESLRCASAAFANLFRAIRLSLHDIPVRQGFLSSSHTQRNVSRDTVTFPRANTSYGLFLLHQIAFQAL